MADDNLPTLYEDVLQTYFTDFKKETQSFSGYIESREHYAKFLGDLADLGIKFVVRSSRSKGRIKAKAAVQNEGHQILFSSKKGTLPIGFFGQPFIVQKSTMLDCKLGGNYRKVKKVPLLQGDQQTPRRQRMKGSKKRDCSAALKIKEVCVYTSEKYAVKPNDSRYKVETAQKKVLDTLKADLEKQNVLKVERFYIQVSSLDVHNHPFELISDSVQTIHPDVAAKINELVSEGITSVKAVKKLLHQYVEEVFAQDEGKPSVTNRAFYPYRSSIRKQMFIAIQQQKYSRIDQENLQLQTEKWQSEEPDAHFFCRQYKITSSKSSEEHVATTQPHYGDDIDTPKAYAETFIFVHQDKLQKHLLKTYGNFCLLDAMYKVTKFDLPLYFVFVKTNVGYSVIAEFIVQFEASDCIAEALKILQDWNPNWVPKYFMSDYSNAELSAISNVFSHCKKYVCDFHREQAWTNWVQKYWSITSRHSENVLSHLRTIASSSTEAAFESYVARFKNSFEWKGTVALQQHMSNTWLPAADLWVRYFRSLDFECNLNSNNGVEAQNKVLVHSYLKNCSNKTALELLRVVVEDYIPDMLHSYVGQNVRLNSDYTLCRTSLPKYLQIRPYVFTKHVTKRIDDAKKIDRSMINVVDANTGLFKVKSCSKNVFYDVAFNIPFCSCPDFEKWRFPCKHFVAIFHLISEWTFDKLCDAYTLNPRLGLDNALLGYSPETAKVPASTLQHIEVVDSSLHSDIDDNSLHSEVDNNSIHTEADDNSLHTEVADDPQHAEAENTTVESLKSCSTAKRRVLDMLDRLKNLVYLYTNEDVMDETYQHLVYAVKLQETGLNIVDGLVLDRDQQTNHKKRPNTLNDEDSIILPASKCQKTDLCGVLE